MFRVVENKKTPAQRADEENRKWYAEQMADEAFAAQQQAFLSFSDVKGEDHG